MALYLGGRKIAGNGGEGVQPHVYLMQSEYDALSATGMLSTDVIYMTKAQGGGGGGGGLQLGETSDTAYRGDRGKEAYDHSQIASGNPHGTTAAQIGAVAVEANKRLMTSDEGTKLAGIAAGATNVTSSTVSGWGFGTYTKPSGGIPSADMDSAVKTALTNARTPTAHTHGNGDLTGIAGWAKAANKPQYTAAEVGALPDTTTHTSGDVQNLAGAAGIKVVASESEITSTTDNVIYFVTGS